MVMLTVSPGLTIRVRGVMVVLGFSGGSRAPTAMTGALMVEDGGATGFSSAILLVTRQVGTVRFSLA